MRRRVGPKIGIAKPEAAAYSVCKLVDVDPGETYYLSTDALIYNHGTSKLVHVRLTVKDLAPVRVEIRFCGRGPDSFEEILEVSNQYLQESRTPRRLLCQEGFGTLNDASYFASQHLWGEPKVERPDAMGAVEEVGEHVYACFGERP